jgi:hypothetical protein
MEVNMNSIDIKNFSTQADEVVNPTNRAKVESVKIGGQRIMKITVQPGWRWSDDIKPLVGTESCQATHLGVIVKGSITAVHNDGSKGTYSAGDAYSIKPGHDGWVEGDEECIAYEFAGAWGE